MTRINVGVKPEELMNQHLIAEIKEIMTNNKFKKTLISIIGLDGSGKDTSADIIQNFYKQKNIDIYRTSNAQYLKHFVCQYYKRTEALFNGKTLRQWMIFFAESCFKPVFGKDFFSEQTIKDIDLNSKKFDIFVKTDDRYSTEFNSNLYLQFSFDIRYILIIKSEKDYVFFNSVDLDPNEFKEKPYLLDLHNFVQDNIEHIDLIFNNGSIEDLKLKLENLLKKEF